MVLKKKGLERGELEVETGRVEGQKKRSGVITRI